MNTQVTSTEMIQFNRGMFGAQAVVSIDRTSGAHGFRVGKQKEFCVRNGVKGAEGKRQFKAYLKASGLQGNAGVCALLGSGEFLSVKAIQGASGNVTITAIPTAKTAVKEW